MIVLISGSPRRRELLSRITSKVIYDVSHVQEPVGEKDPQKLVIKSARAKLKDRLHVHKKGILLACDTIVYADKVLGKPKNREEASQMLVFLSGRSHQVYTSLVLHDKNKGRLVEEVVCTKVYFSSLEEKEIQAYLDTGEYVDKAGGYGIQGFGSLLVEKIEGDYFNVMGLPLNRLYLILKKEFSLDLLRDI